MHKSDLASCVARRIGVNRSPAEDAVGATFEAAGEALSEEREYGSLASAPSARRAPPRTGRSPGDGCDYGGPCFDRPGVQARQAVEGPGEGRDSS